jgi:hypothetical protein
MLRFTIRDLLWLTLLVAICLTWYLAYRQTVAEIDKLEGVIVLLKAESAKDQASIDFLHNQFKKATALNGILSKHRGTDDTTVDVVGNAAPSP